MFGSMFQGTMAHLRYFEVCECKKNFDFLKNILYNATAFHCMIPREEALVYNEKGFYFVILFFMNAKKRYTKNTGAFTLVELIIVITILAILATIAFVSFQGYSRDARNSKRDAEISQLQKLIEVKAANGVNYLDMITQSTGSMMTQAANFNLA